MNIKISDQVFKLVMLLTIFESFSCFEQITHEYGNAKIGEKCERDRNCIQNAYCRAQMTCLCEQYYSPTLDNSRCIASAGLICFNDLTCSSMTNAVCRQGICACKDAYVLDINNSSNCIRRPLIEGDDCQRTDDCQDALGRAMCINERCQCISSYHFVNETGKCIQTRFLYNACKMDYECDFDNQNVLECRNDECVCKEGEIACSKGSVFVSAGILATLLPFIHRLI